MTVSFDSNILIYAFSERSEQHAAAKSLIGQLAERDIAIAEQVLREFLAVAQRTRFVKPVEARQAAADIAETFRILPGTYDDLVRGSELAERHRMQYYDALLCCTARRAGCSFLLSRDMQDGFLVGAMRIVNPFLPANAELIAELLT